MLRASNSLKTLRLEAGVSLSKFARMSDLDRGTVTNAEGGKPVSELTGAKLIKTLSKTLQRQISTKEIFMEVE